jgi:hypothetical protein
VPVDEQLRQKMNADPYKVPGNASRPPGVIVTPSQPMDSNGGVTNVPPIGPSDQLAQLQEIRREQQQLADLDRRFREMILRDASQWDLDSMEKEYRSLQQSATHKPVAGQIDMRFPAIERYRRKLASLMELKQLTSQTELRDAQLLARHTGGAFAANSFGPNVVASPGPESMMAAGQPTQIADAFESFLNRDVSNIASADDGSMLNVPSLGTSASTDDASEIAVPVASGVITPGSPDNRFVGAGIVQKATDPASSSGYVLMAPSGKILADLKPTGNVRLEEFVGQQVGVQGSRWSEKEKRDIIEVSALEAVRIRQ